MLNDVFADLVNILDNVFGLAPAIHEYFTQFGDLIHYVDIFFETISYVTYFVPKIHFLNILGLAFVSVSVRLIISVYCLLNPVK